MLNNRPILIVTIILIVIGLVAAGVWLLTQREDTNPPGINEEQLNNNEESNEDIQIDHIAGEVLPDFENGSEVYLDETVVDRLVRMEQGIPVVDVNGNYKIDDKGELICEDAEEDVEKILNTLVPLINHFAEKEYTTVAHHQVQRFYVELRNSLSDYSFELLCEKIAVCIPQDGAASEGFSELVLQEFGIARGDDFSFVFHAVESAEALVEFCNVLPNSIDISEEDERYCIYESWRNQEDDGYERNLESWLHHIIVTMRENDMNETYISVAQMLYAGTLADAQYKPNWQASLLKCFALKTFTYDAFNTAVKQEFGVGIDSNLPLQEYFEATESGGTK